MVELRCLRRKAHSWLHLSPRFYLLAIRSPASYILYGAQGAVESTSIQLACVPGSILTMDNLRRRKMIVTNACPLCFVAEETVNHIMLNCRMSEQVWNSIARCFDCSLVMPHGLFEAWLLFPRASKYRIMWRLSFLAIIWVIWKERNRHCFEGGSLPVAKVIESARFSVASWVSVLLAFSCVTLDMIMLNWKEVATS